MAETLLTAVTEQILGKVLSLAAEEVSLAWGFKGALEKLAKRLEMIQAVLSDAESKQLTMKSVQLWLKKLNSAAYDADVVLDEFTYEVLRQKVAEKDGMKNKVHDFFSPSKNPLAFRLSMGHKIRNINTSLDQIYEEADKIGLRMVELISSSVQPKEIRFTHPYVEESKVVGRDKDMLIIIDVLLSSNLEKDLPIISIVGMPGLGKTTLAQLAYKDEKVVSHFDQRIWVCVSDDFEVPRLLNQMVESLTGTNPHISNIEGLIENYLVGKLKGKTYLLVLDDIWNEIPEKWDCMINALLGIGGSMGSKILITTRSDVVDSIMQTSHTYQLVGLSEDESWCLFKQKAFANDGAMEIGNFVTIGRELVKRCGGVPLAIRALGGLLYSKKSENKWLSIQNSNIWDSPENTSGVLPTLKLSYNHLPSSSLKRRFSYCSVFPKDSDIEKDRLIQHWMALGLLNPPNGSHLLMEDIGDSYFNTLLQNSLLQDAYHHEYGNIINCKMHDLVHDLAQHTAKGYWSIVEGSKVNDISDVIQLSRIPATSSIEECSKGSFQRLQTLYMLNGVGVIGNMFNKFRRLQVLILRCYEIKKLPSSVGKLKHLRYLDIERTDIHGLPDSIVKLYNLQTLRVSYLDMFPKFFWNLISLRHFHVDSSIMPYECIFVGVRQLTCLQTLPFFRVNRDRGCHLEELGGLNNLIGELQIYGLEDVRSLEDARSANLYKRPNIDALEFNWKSSSQDDHESNNEVVLEGLEPHSNLRSLVIRYFRARKFPTWVMLESRSLLVLNSLVRIILDGCTRCEKIPTLGHLPNLKILKIQGMNNLKHIGPEFYGTHDASSSTGEEAAVMIFPSLRELTLCRFEYLTEWSDAGLLAPLSKVFPCLLMLEIKDCYLLRRIPSHFPSITDLIVNGNKSGLPLEDLLRNRTSLRSLVIESFDDELYLDNILESCSSLEDLTILRCSALVFLPDLQFLTGLRSLTGAFSKELDYFPWPNSSTSLSSLQHLCLIGWQKLKSLPEQLQHLSALMYLILRGFDGLEALPDWLGSLSSLQSLTLWDCEKLMTMPTVEAMQRLTKLQDLDIYDCPLLKERCTEGSGSEWHKIAHIPKRNTF